VFIIKRFNVGGLQLKKKLLVFIVVWKPTLRRINYDLLNEGDLVFMYDIQTKLKINQIYIIKNNMLKSKFCQIIIII